ncbi:histidine kinase [Pseudoalteromonas luteoviolacea]|uniref:diguanylate cyclase n=1 Tax=Pseudoalteromonas luteoviolacea TaxID=43657 RepID=A0A0C1MK72_9GAMM|nr:diguanylate cyclase [Pseudoalteromonas luteoviolacea]KID57449.1 histidine kinase [Pseudoalteromonas luteoviolacea]
MFKEIDDLSDSLVLIVEDSALTQKVLGACLDGLCRVDAVDSAEEAINYCLKSPPDLILMDWILGGMTGLEACKKIQAMDELNDIPIIFVTSNTNENQQELCWDAGAVDFLGKPIVARTLVNRVRTHLKYKRQTDILKQYSFFDGLTEVFNRRYFDMECTRLFRQNLRQQQCMSIIMLDIDYFKLFNDQYGHLQGDDALKAVAKVAVKMVNRPLDSVFRYGGEEFAVLLPNTSEEGALKIAQSIVHAVRGLEIPHCKSEFDVVTVSAGVAVGQYGVYDNVEDLIQKADEGLYKAKSNGRDQAYLINEK